MRPRNLFRCTPDNTDSQLHLTLKHIERRSAPLPLFALTAGGGAGA